MTQVLYSQDWHPADHISFYSNLGLRQLDPTWLSLNHTHVEDIKMFDEVKFKRYPPYKQVLWPDHCIQGSEGEMKKMTLKKNLKFSFQAPISILA